MPCTIPEIAAPEMLAMVTDLEELQNYKARPISLVYRPTYAQIKEATP